jgi:hypothetical protein
MNNSLLTLSFSLLTAVHSQAQTKVPLPPEVRSTLPKGTTSLLVQRLPIGPKGTPVIVHIWAATRPNPPSSNNSYNQYAPSPFCVDIFQPRQNQKQRPIWSLLASAVYISTDKPHSVRTHWLYPAKKTGPILEIISSNNAPGVSVAHTLLVWNSGFREGYESPTPQTLWSGGLGGGIISQDFTAPNPLGDITITTTETVNGKLNSQIRLVWDGERFRKTLTVTFPKEFR